MSDAVVRDVDEYKGYGMPVYCRGIDQKSVRGRSACYGYGIEIRMGGVRVRPGDFILADDNGAVVIPIERLDEVIAFAQKVKATEERVIAEVRAGADPVEAHQRVNYDNMLKAKSWEKALRRHPMPTTLTRRAALQTLLAKAAASAAPALAQAPAYPNRPIRIVCAFPVGGIADTFSRLIGQKLSDAWGQPVVIENRTGAGGDIGADAVAKSPNDGYTILMSNIGTHAVNVHLMKSLPFDPVKDFVPIAHVLDAEGLLVVHLMQATTVLEIIALAKAQPGKLSYASPGQARPVISPANCSRRSPGRHHPRALQGQRAGDQRSARRPVEHMIFATMPTVLPQVKAGKLRAIAVIGAARAAALPDTPTVAETLPGFEVSNWIGLFAPGTPMDIVNRINAEVQKIMRTPDMVKRLEAEGAKFVPPTRRSSASSRRTRSPSGARRFARRTSRSSEGPEHEGPGTEPRRITRRATSLAGLWFLVQIARRINPYARPARRTRAGVSSFHDRVHSDDQLADRLQPERRHQVQEERILRTAPIAQKKRPAANAATVIPPTRFRASGASAFAVDDQSVQQEQHRDQ